VRTATAVMRTTRKVLKRIGIRKLIALCPGCTRTFKEHYKVKQVFHICEFLAKHIDRFTFKKARKRHYIVTYHDPCHLSRHLGIITEPRSLITACPNVELREMYVSQHYNFCCGSGGGVRAYNKALADYASTLRLIEAQRTGAHLLITSCPFCERSFIEAQSLQGQPNQIKQLPVINLVDFICKFI
jgi:heterodisulfide reductase subunit D